MTEITLKKGNGRPSDFALVEAEFALDIDSGKIYSKLADGKVRALNDAEFIGVDTNADNYQYWQYKINGFNTTSVMSTSVVDFQSGNSVEIERSGYGIKISAVGMILSATEPNSPKTGTLWMDATSGEVWIWDESKWLQFPVTGGKSVGGMVISKTEPVDKVNGMQWMDANTGIVFIWDVDKWLEFPK